MAGTTHVEKILMKPYTGDSTGIFASSANSTNVTIPNEYLQYMRNSIDNTGNAGQIMIQSMPSTSAATDIVIGGFDFSGLNNFLRLNPSYTPTEYSVKIKWAKGAYPNYVNSDKSVLYFTNCTTSKAYIKENHPALSDRMVFPDSQIYRTTTISGISTTVEDLINIGSGQQAGRTLGLVFECKGAGGVQGAYGRLLVQGVEIDIVCTLKSSVKIYNGIEWNDYEPYVFDGTEWVGHTPYIYDGNSWEIM